MEPAALYLNVFKDKNNCNTGNIYEIYFALFVLRKMGLTDTDLLTLKPTLDYLESLGHGNKGISAAVEKIKKISCSSNYMFDGKRVVDLKNLTQDDDSGTADVSLVFEDGTSVGISLTEGSGKITKSGLEKVIQNAGVERMGCALDVPAICLLEKSLTKADKDAYCEETYGSDKTKWPKKCKYPAGIEVQSKAAALLGTRMNALPEQEKRKIMNDILCINKMPADYIGFVNKKTYAVTLYKIKERSQFQKHTWIPKIESDGVWLKTYCGEILVSKSQVKYNNGVGTSMRKVNVGAFLDKIFDMELIKAF